MKFLTLTLVLLFVTNAFGAIHQIKPLDENEIESDVEYLYQEVCADLELDNGTFELIFSHIDSLEKELCSLSSFEVKKFKKIETQEVPQFFYAIYSIDADCDGENSMGIIMDSEKNFVTDIFDGDFEL